MKTLLVGDTHLKSRVILPLVTERARALGCRRIILMGDYVDEWQQTNNARLYFAELAYLRAWKMKQLDAGIEVIMLLGNHDADYLAPTPRPYSLMSRTGFAEVGDILFELNIQVAFETQGFVISHAGFTAGHTLQPEFLRLLTKDDQPLITQWSENIGRARGGGYRNLDETGSPIWADYYGELLETPSPNYLKQIVGHTPVEKIVLDASSSTQLLDIDTFSLMRPGYGHERFVGNGDVLLIEDGALRVVPTSWRSSYDVQDYLDYELKL